MTICCKCGIEFEKSQSAGKRYPYRCSSCQTSQKYNPDVHRRQYEARLADPGRREKMLARHALRHAVAAGKIQRHSCEVCGSPKVHGHHDDYSKPFDVRWLCPPHHRAIHNGSIQ